MQNAAKTTLSDPPNDSVSSLCWSQASREVAPSYRQQTSQVRFPEVQYLSVGSWDGTVRTFAVKMYKQNYGAPTIKTEPVKLFSGGWGPILDIHMDTGNSVFSSGADGSVRVHDVKTGESKEIGKHDGPVVAITYHQENNHVISGGVDGFIRAWNGVSNSPVYEYRHEAMIRKIDLKNGFLAVLLANQTVVVHQLSNQQQVTLSNESLTQKNANFKEGQWSAVSLVESYDNGGSSCQGVAVGCISGRVALIPFAKSSQSTRGNSEPPAFHNGVLNNYLLFSCHPSKAKRDAGNPCNPIHDISINYKNIMVTAGGDNCASIYAIGKSRFINTHNMKGPVVAAKLDPFGRFLALGSSYDWAGGCRGMSQNMNIRPTIEVISIGDEVIHPNQYQ